MFLASDLRDWVYDFDLESAPSDILEDGRRRVLDFIGLNFAACATPLGRSVHDGAVTLSGGQVSGPGARVIGFGTILPPANAALVNATLAHAMDFDDTHLATLVHPSAPVIATAFAIGERVGASGRDVLAMTIAGNEISCRLGMAAPGAFHAKGLHPTSVLCTPVAALIAARMLGLDRDGALHAMGIACSQSSGILESYQDGTWVKTLHPGWAAHSGIAAACLAQAGFTGPASGLDGRFGVLRALLDGPSGTPDIAAVTRGLGEAWETRTNFYKLYPCAQVILPFVEMALDARREGLDPDSIRAIKVEIGARYIPVVCEPRETKIAPVTNTQARASIAYAVAAALVHGALDVSHYTQEAIQDPAVRALAARIFHAPLSTDTSEPGFPGAMTIETGEGESRRRLHVSNSGHPNDPGTPQAVMAKFEANSAAVLKPEAFQRVGTMVSTIEVIPRIGLLIDRLRA